MPVVTFTPEEREALNAEAGEHRRCPACGDSQHWKRFHSTPFFEGVLAGHGTVVKGIEALCEECWERMTPDERLPYYAAILDARLISPALPSVIRHRAAHRPVPNAAFDRDRPESEDNPKTVLTEGDWYDDPKDARRYAAAVAALEAERMQIIAAVREGK